MNNNKGRRGKGSIKEEWKERGEVGRRNRVKILLVRVIVIIVGRKRHEGRGEGLRKGVSKVRRGMVLIRVIVFGIVIRTGTK